MRWLTVKEGVSNLDQASHLALVGAEAGSSFQPYPCLLSIVGPGSHPSNVSFYLLWPD